MHEYYKNLSKQLANDYTYHIKSPGKGFKYVTCAYHYKLQCPATGKLSGENLCWKKPHNHTPIKYESILKTMRKQLRQEVTSCFDKLKSVYNKFCLNHPLFGILCPFIKIERTMLRWRESVRPPVPRSISEIISSLEDEKWSNLKDYNEGTLSAIKIEALDQSICIFFCDIEFLKLINSTSINLDATFEVCPRNPKIRQLLTIMAIIDGTAIPIAWVFMEKKTQAAYTAVLEYFKNILAPHIQPLSATIDFEVGLSNAVKSVYPGIKIIRCYFHFTHSLLKKMKKENRPLLQRINLWNEGQTFYRKLIAIPLLPSNEMIPAFGQLLRISSAQVLTEFDVVIRHFNNWWLNKVKPENFSYFKVDNRTNNVIESYHKVLRSHMGSHPDVWQFFDLLKKYQRLVFFEFNAIKAGSIVRRPTPKKYKIANDSFKKAWELYEAGDLDNRRFLACCNHIISAWKNQFLLTDPALVYLFVNAPSHNIDVPLTTRYENFNHPSNDGIINVIQPLPINNVSRILLVENVMKSMCRLCRNSLCNYISTCCGNWLFCRKCLNDVSDQVSTRNRQLICSKCNKNIFTVEKILVS